MPTKTYTVVERDDEYERHYTINVVEEHGGIIRRLEVLKTIYPIPRLGETRIEYKLNISFCTSDSVIDVEFIEVRYNHVGQRREHVHDTIVYTTTDFVATPWCFKLSKLKETIEEKGVRKTIREIIKCISEHIFGVLADMYE